MDTANMDTANRDTANRDTANRDTANRDSAGRDTAGRDAAETQCRRGCDMEKVHAAEVSVQGTESGRQERVQ